MVHLLSVTGTKKPLENKKSKVSLRQFIDWANALGYDVTLVRKKDDPITNVRTRK